MTEVRSQKTEVGSQRLLNGEFGMQPPAHRGDRGLRPGGNAERKDRVLRAQGMAHEGIAHGA